MAPDIIIRNGTVVDGSGSPAFVADVAITGDRITGIEPGIAGTAEREIDATGRLVTPGFVDIHTHLDAQISWDALATSSCWHGVTSIVMGNCGVTFAPVRPADHDYLAAMMESVEDIPALAIKDGLSWEWETYGEYLSMLDRLPKGINVGGMVGHCALRYYAMGSRSADEGAEPTPDELTVMCDLLDEALGAGALGFSTSRTLRHKVPDGRWVPGTFATVDELTALGDVLARRHIGVLEAAPRFDGDGPSEPRARAELAWIAELSRRTGRPFTFNLTHTRANPEHHRLVIELAAAANETGATVRPQTTSRGIGVLFSLGNATPFDRHEPWRALVQHSRGEQLAVIRDPERRARLVDVAREHPAPEELSAFYLTDGLGLGGGAGARYNCAPGTSLPELAAAAGATMAEVYLDALDRSDGAAIVYWPVLNQGFEEIAQMLTSDTVVLGLADAGAHVGQIFDASQPTWFLSYWVRERQLMSIERAIQRLTSDGADMFDLVDRGVLRPGAFADVNVIDLERLTLPLPEFVHDFPHGAGRFIQRAEGYDATIVNGELFMDHGEHSGALAGTVLRSADARAGDRVDNNQRA